MLVGDLTLVIPAYNEVSLLPSLLHNLESFELVAPPLVVDNASTDRTSDVAQQLGATVVSQTRRGKGFAVRAAAEYATTDWLFLCDADIAGLTPDMILELLSLATPGYPVARLALGRPPHSAPVTTLAARPILEALGIRGVAEPLGGLALVDRHFLLNQHLPGGWGFDVALTLAAVAAAGGVPELPCPEITHRVKDLAEYSEMAREVVVAILRSRGLVPWDHNDCLIASTVGCHAMASA